MATNSKNSTPEGKKESHVRVLVKGKSGTLTQSVTLGRHQFLADEPKELGGEDKGPNPYDLLLASLGTCTSMTLLLYAEKKGWNLKDVTVQLNHDKIHAKDCADCETKEGHIDKIERIIHLGGNLDETQRGRLLEIAKRCPVHRTLTSEIQIQTSLGNSAR